MLYYIMRWEIETKINWRIKWNKENEGNEDEDGGKITKKPITGNEKAEGMKKNQKGGLPDTQIGLKEIVTKLNNIKTGTIKWNKKQ